MTSEITSPSRRTIAKGAAWAVPAVAVASAAPSLAASPTACEPGTLDVAINCPPLIGLPPRYEDALSITISNPESSGCTVPADTLFSVSRGGLTDIQVGSLNELNVGVSVFFDSANEGRLTAPLDPGQSVTFEVFPRGLATVALPQTLTVDIEGSTASRSYIIASLLGLVSVAVCG